MGQQQLLLLVLGIVIVGLSVVVGIQAFGENQKKANSDALVNDAIRIASDAQAWVLKPEAFGGGGGNFQNSSGAEAVDISLASLGYQVNGNQTYQNLNGRFRFTSVGANSIEITGNSIDEFDGGYNKVVVTVTGTSPDDIETVVSSEDDAEIGS